MKVIDFIEKHIYGTVDHSMISTLFSDQQVFGMLEQAIALVFSYGNGTTRGFQKRTIETINPGGNILQFHTQHPIISSDIEFYIGEPNISTRFQETGCVCTVEAETEECCKCWDNCCYSGNKINLRKLGPQEPLTANTYKIFGGYAGGGNLGDRVMIKLCEKTCCGNGMEDQSLYMSYSMGPTMFNSLTQTIPLPPMYLVPLALYFKALIIPGMENRAANQEINYMALADEMMKRLDAFDRVNNPTAFTTKRK